MVCFSEEQGILLNMGENHWGAKKKKKKKSKGKKTDVSIGITDSFYCAPETVHCKLTMLLNKIKIKKM